MEGVGNIYYSKKWIYPRKLSCFQFYCFFNSPARGWEKRLQWRLQWPHPVGSFFPGPSKASQFNTVSATPRGNTTNRPGNQPKKNFSVTSMIKSLMRGSIRVGPVYSTTDDPTPLQSQKRSSADTLSSETGWHKKVCWHRKCHPSLCVYALACGKREGQGEREGRERREGVFTPWLKCPANFKILWL